MSEESRLRRETRSAVQTITDSVNSAGLTPHLADASLRKSDAVTDEEFKIIRELQLLVDNAAVTAITTLSDLIGDEEKEDHIRISAARTLLGSAGQYVNRRREFVTSGQRSGQQITVMLQNNVLGIEPNSTNNQP